LAIQILLVINVSTLGKAVTLLALMALMLSSLLMVKADPVGDTPTPSVPEFTVKLVDHSYDVPTTTTKTIDQYTGKETTTTQPSYHVKNVTIEVSIKNQPFTPQYCERFLTTEYSRIYFQIRSKGQYTTEWSAPEPLGGASIDVNCIPQFSGEYTIIPFYANYPDNVEIDFQVRAGIGYNHYVFQEGNTMPTAIVFNVLAESEWSPTQTLKMSKVDSTAIPDTSKPTPTQTTTPQPTSNSNLTPTTTSTEPIGQVNAVLAIDNEKAVIITMVVVIAVLLVALIVSNKRKAVTCKPEVLG
jgi:hypothetical protein